MTTFWQVALFVCLSPAAFFLILAFESWRRQSRDGESPQRLESEIRVSLDVAEKLVIYRKPDGSSAYRPRKEQAYMVHAVEMAKLATCDRLQVGSVFTDAGMTRVLCAGYNGSYAGGPNGCVSKESGNCGDVHAEVNALTKSREDLANSTCFVTTAPCRACAIVLVNRGIKRVVYLNDYRLTEGLDILRASGIVIEKYDDLLG